MYQWNLVFVIAILLTGCCGQNCNQPPTVCQRCRPQTAIIPVINHTECDIAWDLGRELTDEVVDSIVDRRALSVTPLAQYRTAIDRIVGADLFGADLSYANNFDQNDFLVLMELTKHDLQPFRKEQFPHITARKSRETHSVLSMGVRLRVIDLRREVPTLVLQEFVECDQVMSNRAARIDYSILTRDCKQYLETPYCVAHQALADEIAEKIELATLSNW